MSTDRRSSADPSPSPARRSNCCPGSSRSRAYFVFGDYLPLGSQILIMILFALSLDLVLGYAGIVTLGHSAFFGVGAYAAGIYAVARLRRTAVRPAGRQHSPPASSAWHPASSSCARSGLTLLMLTLAVTALLAEAANKASFITGGADGLQGVDIDPILGLFRFDHVRPHRLSLLPRRAVPRLVVRASPGALAVRPLAGRHSRERRPACTRSARRCGGGC